MLLGIRLLGRRPLGGMNIFDLALILALANAVQNAMTASTGDLAAGLVASGTILLLGWALGIFVVRYPLVERGVSGTPIVLCRNGELQREAMRRQGITEAEVLTAIRGYGLADLSEVELVVLEADGTLSVVWRAWPGLSRRRPEQGADDSPR